MKNKTYKVMGTFNIHVEKIVSAKSEAEALRKLRDRTVKYRKIKKSDWVKQEGQTFDLS